MYFKALENRGFLKKDGVSENPGVFEKDRGF